MLPFIDPEVFPMFIPIYQVDAFADHLFAGNPAAVCPLESWPDDRLLQSIASENNLSETAFFVRNGDGFRLRWFTPKKEVALCGHATLASAWVLFEKLSWPGKVIPFETHSGKLLVTRGKEGFLTLDFPADKAQPVEHVPEGLRESLGVAALEIRKGKTDYLYVLDQEEGVLGLRPDFARLAKVEMRGLMVTAPGRKTDFVSRFFAPAVGIDEDPVTGSAHTVLVPYWAERLGKNSLSARQLSARGGSIDCELRGNRVLMSGRCQVYLEGTIRV